MKNGYTEHGLPIQGVYQKGRKPKIDSECPGFAVCEQCQNDEQEALKAFVPKA